MTIETFEQHQAALLVIELLMGSDPALGTPEGEALDLLADAVEAFEAIHYPIAPLTDEEIEQLSKQQPIEE